MSIIFGDRRTLVKRLAIVLGTLTIVGLVAVIGFLVILANSMSRTTYVAVLDVEAALLVAPDQNYPLVRMEIQRQSGDTSMQNPLAVAGGPEEMQINFRAAGPYPYLQILGRELIVESDRQYYSSSNRLDISFLEEDSFYQLNSNERIPFPIRIDEIKNPVTGETHHVNFDFDLPTGLARHRIGYSGGSLYPDAVETVQESQDDLHRFQIGFLADDQPYRIELAFRLSLMERTIAGVPGVP